MYRTLATPAPLPVNGVRDAALMRQLLQDTVIVSIDAEEISI